MTLSLAISEKESPQWFLDPPSCEGELKDFASLNIRLYEDASPVHLTEGLLERRLQDLENLSTGPSVAYWLTFARLTELALFCGGNYADAAEFSAAGDLLVNPRLIRVHLRGEEQGVTKERHVPLSEQFGYAADTAGGVIQWLKYNTIVNVVKEPLLGFLYETLKGSGRFRRAYLESVDERMKQIADTIAFLAVGNSSPRTAPCSDGGPASLSEKAFLESKLCRFGLEHFLRMGSEFRCVLRGETIVSRYLRFSENGLKQPAIKAKYQDWRGPEI